MPAEYDDLFGEPEAEDNDETTDESAETDPSVVAFLDQQSAEFNERAEHEFADRYGFVHKCKCDSDYTDGNLVEVTECYANMTLEALDACATLYAENKLLRSLIKTAVGGAVAEAIGTSTESEGSETD